MTETKFNADLLRKWRQTLFPAIGQGIITGYNIYVDRSLPDAPYVMRYLHAGLGIDDQGNANPHREALLEVLKKEADIKSIARTVYTIVDRLAVYKRGEWKNDPPKVKYFNLNGGEIQRDHVPIYDSLAIIEDKQFELSIAIGDERGAHHVLDNLDKYTYKFLLDAKWNLTDKTNPFAIIGAWDFPLIIVNASQPLMRGDLTNIQEILIFDEDHDLCSLVRKQTRQFEEYLDNLLINYKTATRQANKLFAQGYIDEKY